MLEELNMRVFLDILVRAGFLVEEFAILEVVVGVVTGEGVWYDLGVCVPEVDVSHVFLVVQHIRVIAVIVPEVVKIVLALIVSDDHLCE